MFICTSLFAQKGTKEVGVIQNHKIILTFDKTRILKVYNANLLKLSSIDAKFENVEIIDLNGGNYILLFSGKIWKSSFAIKKVGNNLIAMAKTSCSTSDCASERLGCVVKYAPGDEIGYCTACSNEGKCTKTSSSDSLLE